MNWPFAIGFALAVLAGLSPPSFAAEGASGLTVEQEALDRLYFGDEVVESATRVSKPVSETPENCTIIKAAEIEAMNAHTLAEVLDRVTGVFVQSLDSHQFGEITVAHLQGSGETDWWNLGVGDRQVTLLLDGIPWNQVASGVALLSTLPVGMIEKIEVIRGPASSAWGSALGGVINVITKKVGTTAMPTGQVSLSYGERSAYDARAEAAGGAGIFGYYLYGDRRGANWDQMGAEYAARSLFGKFEVRPTRSWTVGLLLGTSRPEINDQHWASPPVFGENDFRTFVGSLSVDGRFSPSTVLHVAAFQQRLRQNDDYTWDGTPFRTYTPADGELEIHRAYDERNQGAQAHFAWSGRSQTVVIGAEYFKTRAENNYAIGPTLRQYLADIYEDPDYPASLHASSPMERYGIYLNDTLRLGSLTLVPGLRYDDTSRTAPFWSPSLGATWKAGADTVVRAQAARGFTAPPLAYLAGDTAVVPNPSLRPEKVWSFQAGVETKVLPALWVKVTAFRHQVDDYMQQDWDTGQYKNTGKVKRTGVEAEGESASFHGLSAKGGLAYVYVEASGEGRNQDVYQAKGGLTYQRGTFRGELFGRFVWWDLGAGAQEGRYDDFLWDLNLQKTVLQLRFLELDLFGQVHNLFNGRQYTVGDIRNPGRWVEGGVRISF